MPSKKYSAWDFLSQTGSLQSHHIWTIQSFHPFYTSLFLDKGEQKSPAKWRKVLANELSLDFLETYFINLDLFSPKGPLIVLGEAPSRVHHWLLEHAQAELAYPLILIGEKSTSFTKKLNTLLKERSLIVEQPAFWETKKMLEFLGREFHLSFDYAVSECLLERVEHDFASLYQAVVALSPWATQHGEDIYRVNLSLVEQLFPYGLIDKFKLADWFGLQRWKEFWENWLKTEGRWEDDLSFIYFLQSHLNKLADPEYQKQKKRLSQYDQKISQQSQLWDLDSIHLWMEKLNEWELMAKKQRPDFRHVLKREYLRSLEAV